MSVPQNVANLEAAVSEVITDLQSFVAAYGVFAKILSAKTGSEVKPTYNAIKAALEGLPEV